MHNAGAKKAMTPRSFRTALIDMIYQGAMLALIAAILIPWHLILIVFGRYSYKDLLERLGKASPPPRRGRLRMVLHGSSFGEISSLGRIVSFLGSGAGDIEVVITYFNRDGKRAAERLRQLNMCVLHIQYLPWDVRLLVNRWLRHLHPDLVAVVEMELWPGLFQACGRFGIPLCVVSARMEDSAEMWYRVVGSWTKAVLSCPRQILTRDAKERQRFISLGADPASVLVRGDLKWSTDPASLSEDGVDLSSFLEGRTLIVAGSTHEPEEHWLSDALEQLRVSHPGLSLVLAPRKVGRSKRLVRILSRGELKVSLWSKVREAIKLEWDILVLDEMGWLQRFYAHAKIAVVGGSFVNHGGHNVVEAAGLGHPVVVGPFVENIAGIVRELSKAGAVRWLGGFGELAEALRELIEDQAEARSMGERAKAIDLSHQNIAQEYARTLIHLAENAHVRPGGAEAGPV